MAIPVMQRMPGTRRTGAERKCVDPRMLYPDQLAHGDICVLRKPGRCDSRGRSALGVDAPVPVCDASEIEAQARKVFRAGSRWPRRSDSRGLVARSKIGKLFVAQTLIGIA